MQAEQDKSNHKKYQDFGRISSSSAIPRTHLKRSKHS
jgi:hypothetical protein